MISGLKSALKVLYGEIFNFKIPLKIRIYRIIARSNLSKIFEKYYVASRQNEKLETFENDYIVINEDLSTKELLQDGITLNLNLKSKIVEDVINFIQDKDFRFNRDKNRTIKFSERNNYKDLYILNYMNPHLNSKIINKVLLNQKLVSVVKNYLKVNPILEWSQIYWSLPLKDKGENTSITKNNEFGFHYDIDGFKFLKVFFYLTDVTKDDGPHVFVKKSKEKTLYKALNRRINDQEVKNKFNDNKIIITGKKGVGFLEDTSFYHKGTAPIHERGVLMCLYNISKW